MCCNQLTMQLCSPPGSYELVLREPSVACEALAVLSADQYE